MSLEGKHIFIVEDNVVNFAVIRTILRKADASVPFDNWGDTTLEKMRNYPFPLDMILLDLMLAHGISGYDVYDALQDVPELKDVPVVCVSAADPNIEIPKAKDKGFRGFIAKPIRQRTFVKQLEAILAGDDSIWGTDDFV